MTDKVLMCSTVSSTIQAFNMDNIRILQGMGYEVHIACDFQEESKERPEYVGDFKRQLDALGIRYFQVGFSRKPLDCRSHARAYRQLTGLFRENDYAFVHCHTPIASAICRVAAHKTHIPCIYTAHGFHFFKGAPLRNWLVFYPMEKLLSYWTDVLITINKEDFERARRKLAAKKTVYVPGVGIDLKKFQPGQADASKKRAELGLSDTDIMILSVGELNHNKNHELVIRAIKEASNPHIKYCVCGKGKLEGFLNELAADLGIGQQVSLLGFRPDIPELCQAADLFIFPSHREGLPVSLMEAIASQTPVMCSKIRGNTDLVNEFLFDDKDAHSLARLLAKYVGTRAGVQEIMGEVTSGNYARLLKFSLGNVSNDMFKIYTAFGGEQCCTA